MTPLHAPPHVTTPTHLKLPLPIVAIACGAEHAIAIASNRTLFAWGYNTYGQLGLGDFEAKDEPTPLLCRELSVRLHQATGRSQYRLVTGAFTTALVFPDAVWVWGRLASLDLSPSPDPRESPHVARILAIDGPLVDILFGLDQALALTHSGALYTWSTRSQAGVLPVPMPERPVLQMALGSKHALALTKAGHIYAWGANGLGQCGVGTFASLIPSPQRVLGVPLLNTASVRLACFGHASLLQIDHGQLSFVWGVVGPVLCTHTPVELPPFRKAPPPSPPVGVLGTPHSLGFERSLPKKTSLYTLGPIVCKGREHIGDVAKLHLSRGALTIQPIYEHASPALAVLATPLLSTKGVLTVSPIESSTKGLYTSWFHAQHSGTWQLWLASSQQTASLVVGGPWTLKVQLSEAVAPSRQTTPAFDHPRLAHVAVQTNASTVWHATSPELPCRVTMDHPVLLRFDLAGCTDLNDDDWAVESLGATVATTSHAIDRVAATMVVTLKYISAGTSTVVLRRSGRARLHRKAPSTVEVHVTYKVASVVRCAQLHRLAMQSYLCSVDNSIPKLCAWITGHKELSLYLQHSVILEVLTQHRITYGWDVWRDLQSELQQWTVVAWLDFDALLKKLATSNTMTSPRHQPASVESALAADATWFLSIYPEPPALHGGGLSARPHPRTPLSMQDLVVPRSAPSEAAILLDAHPSIVLPIAAQYTLWGDFLLATAHREPLESGSCGLSGPLHELRQLLLERRRSAQRSLRDLYHHFHRDLKSTGDGFDLRAFRVAINDLRIMLTPEESFDAFQRLCVDGTSHVGFGAFRLFVLEPTFQSFWHTYAPRVIATLRAHSTTSIDAWRKHFEAAFEQLQTGSGYETVRTAANGDLDWEVFAHGLLLLVPSTSPRDLIRLVYRFDTRGDGVVQATNVLRALHQWATMTLDAPRTERGSSSNVLARDRPQIDAFSSHKAVQKLYRSRAQAYALETSEDAALLRQGNELLTRTTKKPVHWLLEQGLSFRPQARGLSLDKPGVYDAAELSVDQLDS
ncbi:hypothetical protein SDRG_11139 [Saprolegnia diclina VS20]|uniref:EF-hand domain-containing protein n=1 Tax=Saprolegnia diclina (strain VS20) TaxID=1156394 RepID=T0Q972_SAPDV|nr:hypothetical protein SDRG_11139 [Saprolegnia diclina VS20]EQC31216.1 hypothetical protein SDRG_11139 [Saprolegnia diclina VS20]|eukprot:XP_008615389.1 hypothetical protein SDRG_11139 [Saprolegnia diclina VS20]